VRGRVSSGYVEVSSSSPVLGSVSHLPAPLELVPVPCALCVVGGCTLGSGCSGDCRGVTLGVGAVRLSLSRAGAISSKIAANFLIACILSAPGCLNGVVGAGCCRACARSAAAIAAASALDIPGTLQCWGGILLCHISFNVQLLNSIFGELGSVPLPVRHILRSGHVVPMILFYPVFRE
jgi:hypothetical protein